MKILIIEDRTPEAYLLASLCEGPFRVVQMVETLAQAWRHLTNVRFDVVFLDLTLPGSDPLETLNEVPAIKKLSRCVIVTGNQNPAFPERAKEVGADAFLLKDDPEFADRVLSQLKETEKPR